MTFGIGTHRNTNFKKNVIEYQSLKDFFIQRNAHLGHRLVKLGYGAFKTPELAGFTRLTVSMPVCANIALHETSVWCKKKG